MMLIEHAISRVMCAVACLLLGGAAWAQPVTPTDADGVQAPAGPQFVDGIAAVVNKQVITLRQLENETAVVVTQLQQQGIALPESGILRDQVLSRMITEALLDQEAERLNISVGDAQLEYAVQAVAQRNNMTVDALRAEIEATGVAWPIYLDGLATEIRNDQLRHRVLDSQIFISDAEIDAFLKNQGRVTSGLGQLQAGPVAPEIIGLSQILIVVPENASSTEVEQFRRQAEHLLQQVQGGADFAAVAAASSKGPEALQGGDMGMRPLEGWPDLFVEAVRSVPEGGVSGLVRSGNGFHILKVTHRQQAGPQQAAGGPTPATGMPDMPQGPMIVTQTRARHILIKSSPAMSEARAVERLQQLRQRIVAGESFADLARRYSEDSSAPQGGDLGWTTPGDMVPAFEHA